MLESVENFTQNLFAPDRSAHSLSGFFREPEHYIQLNFSKENVFMSVLLLLVIYIAFIGLGVPDSLFGSAWPAIYREFSLPVSFANLVTLLISGCTILSSLSSAKMISRFGTSKVTALSTALTAVALFGFSVSRSFPVMCLFAIPLGFGAGAIDAALNNYVSVHYRAMHMNFLHCFYGIGVSLSPYLMSFALQEKNSWRTGYRLAFWVQLAITLMTVAALPLWRMVKKSDAPDDSQIEAIPVKSSQMLKKPAVRSAGGIFIASCGIEYTAGTWGSTYLVQTRGLTAGSAARMLMLYYVGIALGRFLSGILSAVFPKQMSSQRLIICGQMTLAAAIVLMLLPLPPTVSAISFFLIGLGTGPIFPNLIHVIPQYCGAAYAQSYIGLLMATAYVGIMLAPALFGWLAQFISVYLFPWYLLVLLALLVLCTASAAGKLRTK